MNSSRKKDSMKKATGKENNTMEIVNVTTKEQLDYLYWESAFSIEGLSPEYIPTLMKKLKKDTTIIRERVFVIKGKVMNKMYHLTGSNAYQDNFHIVSISLEDIDPWPMMILSTRLSYGARWFDDIVDNDLERESL